MWSIGRNPTIEALRSSWKVHEILLHQGISVDEKISEIVSYAERNQIPLQYTDKKQLDKISKGEPHQGVAAKVDWHLSNLDRDELVENPGLYIYIREAQYEQNLGAIIRTAEVAGAKGVIISPKQHITDVVARISMGALFHLPIYSYSLFPALSLFSKAGYQVCGIERGGENIFEKDDFSESLLLIIGGEDYSLSQEVQDKCDATVTIPQFGEVNSLNMSVAAGIVIYTYVAKIKYRFT